MAGASRWSWAWVMWGVGCAPWRFDEVLCDAQPPEAGTVHIGPLLCSDQLPTGGNGRIGADLYVATPTYRAILRSPQDALTLSGTGGLTLVDWARWGESDMLHELVPLVDGGWLHPTDWTVGARTVEVIGVVGALPDRDTPQGAASSVVWTFPADRPCVQATGADGWFVHASGGVERQGRSLQRGSTTLASGGSVTDDLGGAMRLAEGELCLDASRDVWSWLGSTAISGDADGELELWSDDELVGRLPRGSFDTTVPDVVSRVRAVADDAAPGDFLAIGHDLTPTTGPAGSVDLALPEDGRWRSVAWTHADGRSGTTILPSGGGSVGTGAGTVTLTVTRGPTDEPWSQTLEVVGDDDPTTTTTDTAAESEPLLVEVEARFAQGAWASVGIGRPSDRSRSWRGTDARALSLGAADGLDYQVFLVEDGTTEVLPTELGHPRLVAHGGSRYRGVEGEVPWVVDAWPVRLSERKNAWGTVQFPFDGAAHALQLADGGAGRLRTLAVDLPTLGLLGAPHAPDRAPDAVYLPPPSDDLAEWTPWFRWLDAAKLLVPLGDFTWAPVADPRQLVLAEVEAAIRRGAVVTGSGERLVVTVDGAGPGAVLPELGAAQPTGTTGATATTADTGTRSPRPRRLVVDELTDGLERLRVIGEGGEVWHDGPAEPTTLDVPADVGRWLVVLGTGGDGAWAVSGPVWLSPPR